MSPTISPNFRKSVTLVADGTTSVQSERRKADITVCAACQFLYPGPYLWFVLVLNLNVMRRVHIT